MNYYIIELDTDQLKLIGQLLHIHLDDQKSHPVGESLLYELMTQTECVFKDPKSHSVGNGIANLRHDMVMSHSAWYIPVDTAKEENGLLS